MNIFFFFCNKKHEILKMYMNFLKQNKYNFIRYLSRNKSEIMMLLVS